MSYFTPVSIPFTQGIREDEADFSTAGEPSGLTTAQNVVFTNKGGVKGRPGAVSADTTAQLLGGDAATYGSVAEYLQSVDTAPTAAGICSAAGVPALLYQGACFFKAGDIWRSPGSGWFTRVTRSAVLENITTDGVMPCIPCGDTIIGYPMPVGSYVGYPYVDSSGVVTGVSTAPSAAATVPRACAGNAVFSIESGSVYAVIPGAFPAGSVVTLSTTASAPATAVQCISAVEGAAGEYYVAFLSSTAGRITVLTVSDAGAVTATLDLSGLGTPIATALAFDGTNRLCLGYVDDTANEFKTKIIATSGGTLTALAFDMTHATVETNVRFMAIGVGKAHTGVATLMARTTGNSVMYSSREWTNTTPGSTGYLYGSVTLDTGLTWGLMFSGVTVAGRTVAGVLRSSRLLREAAQWVLIDLTDFYDSGLARIGVVAASQPDTCMLTMVHPPATPDSETLSFGVCEGLTFDTSGVVTAGVRRVDISLQPAASADAMGLTFFTGGCLHAFDGRQLKPHGFVEGSPRALSGTIIPGPGGITTAGDYSYQATWETYDGQGQVIRSGATNIITKTVATGESVDVVVTVPLLRTYLNAADKVIVKLYATEANPSDGAEKYLVDTEEVTTTPSAATVTLRHSDDTDTSEERLYENGGVLADEPPPAGDRGVAFAIDRVWVADQRRVYASKLLKTLYSPAFSTVGLHTLEVPMQAGQVQAIAGLDDKLIVICSNAILAVQGPGVDDLGTGPGWSMQQVSPVGMGASASPRSVAAMPEGVAFQAEDGDIWAITRSLQVLPISRPVRRSGPPSSHGPKDLAYVMSRSTSSGSTNPMLMVAGTSGQRDMRVLDLEVQQWAMWTGTPREIEYIAGVNGELWGQNTGLLSVVYVFNGDDTGQDAGAAFTQTVEMGPIPIARAPAAYGRLRGVTPIAKASSNFTTDVTVYADKARDVILDVNAESIDTTDTEVHEFRTSRQRCGFVWVSLTASPGLVEWTSLDLWVHSGTQHRTTGYRS